MTKIFEMISLIFCNPNFFYKCWIHAHFTLFFLHVFIFFVVDSPASGGDVGAYTGSAVEARGQGDHTVRHCRQEGPHQLSDIYFSKCGSGSGTVVQTGSGPNTFWMENYILILKLTERIFSYWSFRYYFYYFRLFKMFMVKHWTLLIQDPNTRGSMNAALCGSW